MDNEQRLEVIMDIYDEQVAGISLDDAIDVTLALAEQASERLAALREDKARQA